MSSALRAPPAHKMYTLRSTACFLLTAFVSVLAFQPFVGIVFFCFAFSSSRLRAGHGSWISTSSDVLPSTSLGPIASLTDAGRNAIATTTSKSNP
jgi:hypothetical protein